MGLRIGITCLLAAPIVLAVGISTAKAQTDDPARPVLGQTGKIFALQYTPASKKITIALAGKPAVTIGPERILIFGKQFPSGSKSGKSLNINAAENSFEILDALEANSTLEIEVHDRTTKKRETFKVQQKALP